MVENTNYDFFAAEGEDESSNTNSDQNPKEKILIVDDEKDIHIVTKMAMEDFLYEGNAIGILSAYSLDEAKNLLLLHEDISLVLLDVVMETDTAGLDLVTYIREELRNKNIRIVLRTGQPGVITEKAAVEDYDIDDYRTKTELTADKLYSVVKTGMNTYGLMKQMENKLIESQKRYKLIFDHSPLPYHSLALDGEILSVNPMWLNTMGYTKEEIIGTQFGDLIHSDNRDYFEEHFCQFKKEGKISNVILRLRKKDSNYISVSLNGEIGFDNVGELKHTFCIFKDITKELKLENEVKQLYNNYNEVVSNITTGVWKIDFEKGETFKNAYLSPVMDELLALPRGTLNSDWKKYLSHIKPEYRELVGKSFKESFENPSKAVTCEYEVIKANGESAWFQSQGRSIIENNKPHFFGSTLDITEQKQSIEKLKQSEEALQKSEEKFRLLAENSVDIIWKMDPYLKFTYVSPSLEKLMGYKPEEWIGTNLNKHFTKNEFIKAGGIALKAIKEYKTIGNFAFETKMLDKNKREIDVEIRGSVLRDSKGKLLGLQGTTIGIEEKIKSEKLQSAIYNISNEGNITRDLTMFVKKIKSELNAIIDTSNFYVALYESETDTFNLPHMSDEKKTRKSFPAAYTLSKYVLDTCKPLLATKDQIFKLEQKGIIKNSGPDCEIWLGIPLKIDKKAIGLIAVQSYKNKNAFDNADKKMLEFVSEQISILILRKKNELDLQQQNEEYEILNEELKSSLNQINLINKELEESKNKAEESDRLKSAFLANMSHEIRTPMNGILGFTSLLSKPGLSGQKQSQYIDIISKSGKRMLHTVDNLMDISMIESGQMKVSYSKTNITDYCENLFKFFKPEANKKGLQLVANNMLHEDNNWIETDSEKFYAVLSNLIKNAIKYTHKGAIEIGCSKKQDFIEFYVKDSGIGITDNRQLAVFDRFVQADIEDRAAYEGSGLGLSIAKAYVEMLGGSIWLESKENVGSTFFFTIPSKQIAKDIAPTLTNDNIYKLPDILNKLKILIAEDEIFAFEYLKIILKPYGSDILHAKTGREAIELSTKNPDIDLILMDIKMPGMSGYDATRIIRETNKEVIIIAQTAYAQSKDRKLSIEAGCNDYIAKPIDKDILIKMIINNLKNK